VRNEVSPAVKTPPALRRSQIVALAGDDAELRFAYTRKIGKELTYFERGKPMMRRKLKREKVAEQNGQCAICNADLPASYNVLDRLTASGGYTAANTRAICRPCDEQVQASRGYA